MTPLDPLGPVVWHWQYITGFTARVEVKVTLKLNFLVNF